MPGAEERAQTPRQCVPVEPLEAPQQGWIGRNDAIEAAGVRVQAEASRVIHEPQAVPGIHEHVPRVPVEVVDECVEEVHRLERLRETLVERGPTRILAVLVSGLGFFDPELQRALDSVDGPENAGGDTLDSQKPRELVRGALVDVAVVEVADGLFSDPGARFLLVDGAEDRVGLDARGAKEELLRKVRRPAKLLTGNHFRVSQESFRIGVAFERECVSVGSEEGRSPEVREQQKGQKQIRHHEYGTPARRKGFKGLLLVIRKRRGSPASARVPG
jgi:hypothetical protein